MLLKHIDPAMNLIRRGESQLLDRQSLGLGQLHIGASDTICRYLLVPYLKQFHKKFPKVPIKVTNATSLECVDLLEQGKVDMVVTNFPNTRLNTSYIQRTVCEFKDVFIASPAYYDVASIKTLEDLNKHPILMLGRQSTTSDFLHNLFLQHQMELIPEVELSSNDLLIDLARIGLGIALVPDYCLQSNEKELVRINVAETIPTRRIVAAANPTIPASGSTQEFMSLLPTL